MSKHVLFLVVFTFALSTQFVNAQTWRWATKAGGFGTEYATAIDVDNSGNSYITGKFQDSMSFGSITLSKPGYWSVFIAKYDITGNVVWAKIAASGTLIDVTDITVNKLGQPSIVGLFHDTARFGTTNPTTFNTPDFDVFVASYTNTGTLRWAKSAGGTGYDYGAGIGSDAFGNCYITGEFHLSSFNGSAARIFIAKYDSTGNCPWFHLAKNFSNGTYGNGIKTDSMGNSYIVGQYFTSLTFDSIKILDAGNIESNIYFGRFDAAGNNLWLQKGGAATGYAGGAAIGIDNAGNSYVTGFFHGTISLGSFSLAGQFGLNLEAFIAKCDVNGNYLWAKKPVGPGNAHQIATDKNGNSYLIGLFNTSISFGTTTLTNTGASDIYVAKINNAGNFDWATQYGGAAGLGIGDITTNENGVFITGSFLDTVHFGSSYSLTAQGTLQDIFVARMQDNTLAIRDNHRPQYTLYPNPASDEIHLKGLIGNGRYTIWDECGRLVDKGTIEKTNSISIRHLIQGIYSIQIEINGGQQQSGWGKFIKK